MKKLISILLIVAIVAPLAPTTSSSEGLQGFRHPELSTEALSPGALWIRHQCTTSRSILAIRKTIASAGEQLLMARELPRHLKGDAVVEPFLASHRPRMRRAFWMGLAMSGIATISPFVALRLYDTAELGVSTAGSFPAMVLYSAFLLAFVAGNWLDLYLDYILETIGLDLDKEVTRHLTLHLPPPELIERPVEYADHIFSGPSFLGTKNVDLPVLLPRWTMHIVANAAFLWWLDVQIFMLAVAVIPVIVVISVRQGMRMHSLSRAIRESSALTKAELETAFQVDAKDTSRAGKLRSAIIRRFNKSAGELTTLEIERARQSALFSAQLDTLTDVGMFVLVTLIGTWDLYLYGQPSMGTIVAISAFAVNLKDGVVNLFELLQEMVESIGGSQFILDHWPATAGEDIRFFDADVEKRFIMSLAPLADLPSSAWPDELTPLYRRGLRITRDWDLYTRSLHASRRTGEHWYYFQPARLRLVGHASDSVRQSLLLEKLKTYGVSGSMTGGHYMVFQRGERMAYSLVSRGTVSATTAEFLRRLLNRSLREDSGPAKGLPKTISVQAARNLYTIYQKGRTPYDYLHTALILDSQTPDATIVISEDILNELGSFHELGPNDLRLSHGIFPFHADLALQALEKVAHEVTHALGPQAMRLQEAATVAESFVLVLETLLRQAHQAARFPVAYVWGLFHALNHAHMRPELNTLAAELERVYASRQENETTIDTLRFLIRSFIHRHEAWIDTPIADLAEELRLFSKSPEKTRRRAKAILRLDDILFSPDSPRQHRRAKDIVRAISIQFMPESDDSYSDYDRLMGAWTPLHTALANTVLTDAERDAVLAAWRSIKDAEGVSFESSGIPTEFQSPLTAWRHTVQSLRSRSSFQESILSSFWSAFEGHLKPFSSHNSEPFVQRSHSAEPPRQQPERPDAPVRPEITDATRRIYRQVSLEKLQEWEGILEKILQESRKRVLTLAELVELARTQMLERGLATARDRSPFLSQLGHMLRDSEDLPAAQRPSRSRLLRQTLMAHRALARRTLREFQGNTTSLHDRSTAPERKLLSAA